jgi:hypothetical protein
MSEDLPRRPRHHELADQGARITQSVLPAGWVYRARGGKGDYGIDAEVGSLDGLPTGCSFRLQLKAHERCSWTATDSCVEPVKDVTRNYWRLHPLPVILVACDVGLREASGPLPTKRRQRAASEFVAATNYPKLRGHFERSQGSVEPDRPHRDAARRATSGAALDQLAGRD